MFLSERQGASRITVSRSDSESVKLNSVRSARPSSHFGIPCTRAGGQDWRLLQLYVSITSGFIRSGL